MENKTKATICLTMIVKNEAHVIARCLNSVKSIIDYWVIVDTGSTDSTIMVIEEILQDIPGKLYEKQWVNFSYNRNQALGYAENKADYILMIDADEEVVMGENLNLFLDKNAYQIEIFSEDSKFYRLPLFKNNQGWRYEGVIHEYINIPKNVPLILLKNIHILTYGDGCRGRDESKLQHDIIMLHAGLSEEPDNAHYLFYLGRYYFMTNNLEKAHEYLLQCIDKLQNNNFTNSNQYPMAEFECWYSYLLLAELEKHMHYPHHVIQMKYLYAFMYNSAHSSPLYLLAKIYCEKNFFHTAYIFLHQIINMPPSEPISFLHKDIFYFLKTDFVACAFNVKRYDESLKINTEIVNDVACPEHFRQTAIHNQTIITNALISQKKN